MSTEVYWLLSIDGYVLVSRTAAIHSSSTNLVRIMDIECSHRHESRPQRLYDQVRLHLEALDYYTIMVMELLMIIFIASLDMPGTNTVTLDWCIDIFKHASSYPSK